MDSDWRPFYQHPADQHGQRHVQTDNQLSTLIRHRKGQKDNTLGKYHLKGRNTQQKESPQKRKPLRDTRETPQKNRNRRMKYFAPPPVSSLEEKDTSAKTISTSSPQNLSLSWAAQAVQAVGFPRASHGGKHPTWCFIEEISAGFGDWSPWGVCWHRKYIDVCCTNQDKYASMFLNMHTSCYMICLHILAYAARTYTIIYIYTHMYIHCFKQKLFLCSSRTIEQVAWPSYVNDLRMQIF